MDDINRRHRPIRSFVLRGDRLTSAQERAFEELWPLYGIDWSPGGPLDPRDLYGNARPVNLEIGFGNGETLARMAEAASDVNWLGIEVHRPGVGHLLLEIDQRDLKNLRVIRQDAVELLTQALAPASLERVQLYFPDPWPKKKHHKRRILNPAFVQILARVIRPGGIFHAATDWEPYAQQMLNVLSAADEVFENTLGPGRFSSRPEYRPLTKFEQRGQRLGHPVHDLIFRRRG